VEKIKRETNNGPASSDERQEFLENGKDFIHLGQLIF
jgi:hypothetical protein